MATRLESNKKHSEVNEDASECQQKCSQPNIGVSHFRLLLKWFTRRENITVCAIALIILILHLLIIGKPATMMFDEKSYVPEANSFLSGNGLTIPEHPPLGKWLIATGISVFGNNAVGWRIFSVIFGVASIFIFYLLCVQLVGKEVSGDVIPKTDSPELPKKRSWFTMTTFVPVFATFLFAFENLSFVQANIAMLDVFCFTFMLLGFLLYIKGHYLSSGIVMGLSTLCKATAVLAILTILLHWVLTYRKDITSEIRHLTNKLIGQKMISEHSFLWDMGKLLIGAVVVWFILLPLLEYPATHQFANPISRTLYMLNFHLNYNTTLGFNPNSTMPWQWIASPTSIIYWPISFVFISGHFAMEINSNNPLYYASVSWNIWVLILLSMLYLIYEIFRSSKIQHKVATFVLSWFAGVYVLLIPLELLTKRVMFTYYFYPAIPAVCLAISLSVWKLWLCMRKEKKRRVIFLSLLAVYVFSTVIIFFFMSPFGGHILFSI